MSTIWPIVPFRLWSVLWIGQQRSRSLAMVRAQTEGEERIQRFCEPCS
ncbi:unnamed protein product [Arabidopsis halleri]